MRLRNVLAWMSILAVIAAAEPAKANPFEKFFRTLKKTFTQPPRKTPARRKSAKKSTAQTSPDPSNKTANTPPSGGNTRTATRVSSAKAGKADFPYGTPVPGKQGFVTSPFAPDSGYIDVRGFPPGTPVKDPYTNKVFLTP